MKVVILKLKFKKEYCSLLIMPITEEGRSIRNPLHPVILRKPESTCFKKVTFFWLLLTNYEFKVVR